MNLLHFRFGHIPEVPPVELDGRLQSQSGPRQTIQPHVFKLAAYVASALKSSSSMAMRTESHWSITWRAKRAEAR